MEEPSGSNINFDTEERPFVLPAEDGPLNAWPCAHWTLDEWAEQLGEVRFKFRVHPRKQRPDDTGVHWESEAVSYVDATVAHLLAHVRRGRGTETERDKAVGTAPTTTTTSESSDANPFESFPTEEYCFYSGYNYMTEVSECKPALLDTVRWRDTAGGLLLLGEQVLNDGRKSTLWLGTSGAYTPAHMDTYGYNFVAQLQGRKRWILFPPADTAHLYPVRIPFEESSIFSEVNFKRIDLLQFPLVRHSTPHVVELKAGEVLFVPRHWWHFVENVQDDDQEMQGDSPLQQTVSISINMWVTGDERENSISEGLVQFLARPLLEAYGDATWLNLGADLLSAPEAGRILKALLNAKQKEEERESDETPEKDAKRQRTLLNRRFVSPCKLEDIGVQVEKSTSSGDDLRQPQKQIDLKDIVNCILDPEVIDLIKSKLRRCAISGSPVHDLSCQ